MSSAAARLPIDNPSRPSTVASETACRKIAARVRSPVGRFARTATVDKIARSFVLSKPARTIVLFQETEPRGATMKKSLKTKLAVLALTAGTGLAVMATPAFAAAGPNNGGTNCHGVV